MKVTNVSSENNQRYRSLSLASEVHKTIELLRDRGATVGFAESCTGGLLSSEFTKVSGVSDIFVGSVVCYSNSVKENVLAVESETLRKFGAVSFECAEELSFGTLKILNSAFAISITGVAGPSGGSPEKPVGTIYISVAGANSVVKNYKHQMCEGFEEIQEQVKKEIQKEIQKEIRKEINREEIQKMSCIAALEHLQNLIK